MYLNESEWQKKGGTFSDKTARKEYGLTQEEIIKALNEGKLQARINYIHGNPYFRLIRSEIEDYIIKTYGKEHLEKKKYQYELSQIITEERKIKSHQKILQKRKDELETILKQM